MSRLTINHFSCQSNYHHHNYLRSKLQNSLYGIHRTELEIIFLESTSRFPLSLSKNGFFSQMWMLRCIHGGPTNSFFVSKSVHYVGVFLNRTNFSFNFLWFCKKNNLLLYFLLNQFSFEEENNVVSSFWTPNNKLF